MELKRMLTPRDSESVLDRLDSLERKAMETVPLTWCHSGEVGGVCDLMLKDERGLIALSRNHLRALLDVARAAQAHYDEWASINAFEHLPLPIQAIGQALAPLTPPSEQKEET